MLDIVATLIWREAQNPPSSPSPSSLLQLEHFAFSVGIQTNRLMHKIGVTFCMIYDTNKVHVQIIWNNSSLSKAIYFLLKISFGAICPNLETLGFWPKRSSFGLTDLKTKTMEANAQSSQDLTKKSRDLTEIVIILNVGAKSCEAGALWCAAAGVVILVVLGVGE